MSKICVEIEINFPIKRIKLTKKSAFELLTLTV